MVPQMWMAERRMRCVHLDANGNGQSPPVVTAADTGSARNQAEPAARWMVGRAYAIFRSRSLLAAPVSANNAIISRLNAGMSSGLRLVTNPLSVTTSLSTQVPPALRMSVLSEGHEVSVRPCAASNSTTVHGPWQIAARTCLHQKNVSLNARCRGSCEGCQNSLLRRATTSASHLDGSAELSGTSTGNSSPQSV
jgi:hypothetical protein